MWLINEFESDDPSKWPEKPPCLDFNKPYFSFRRKVIHERASQFPVDFLDPTKGVLRDADAQTSRRS